MKKILVILLLMAVTILNAAESKFGKEITLKEKTSISKILAAPDRFEGKTVLVEGEVLDVCQDSGCWIEVAGTRKGEKIKVKVEDGVIVFPKEAKGKKALVEGKLEEVKEDECASHEVKDEKAAKTEKHEGCGGCGGEQSEKVYQIKGLGAVIK